MPREQLIQSLFWTGKGAGDTALSDPLGLDALREEISDGLAPCLTGRTRSLNEAFWCLTLLRWARIAHPRRIEQGFLEWERYLKLVWSRYPRDSRTLALASFTGSDRAAEQASAPDAPRTAFKALLADQRSQGLLGQYLSMLRQLGLVDGVELTELGETWSAGSGEPPKLRDGEWKQWRGGFGQAAQSFPHFRRRLRVSIRAQMPKLRAGLAKAGWGQEVNWLGAAPAMGKLGKTARFAHRYCAWADLMRLTFDRLSKDGLGGQKIRWPSPPEIPSGFGTAKRNGKRWARVREYAKAKPGARLRFAVNWHQAELADRGYGNAEFWLTLAPHGTKVHARSHNLPQNERYEGGDCRWSNAVNLMRP